jgi:hypothetical protein
MTDAVLRSLELALNSLLVVVGLFLANNFRRQLQLKMVDRRAEAYGRLWALMRVAGPWRVETGQGLLDKTERWNLYHCMSSWYFSGDGMLLEEKTRDLYLNAKFNLVCEDHKLRLTLETKKDRDKLDGELKKQPEQLDRWRSLLSMRELSLLRTQMKSDLEIRGYTYQGALTWLDVAFLKTARIDPRKRPWKANQVADPKNPFDPFLKKAGWTDVDLPPVRKLEEGELICGQSGNTVGSTT